MCKLVTIVSKCNLHWIGFENNMCLEVVVMTTTHSLLWYLDVKMLKIKFYFLLITSNYKYVL